MYVTKVGNPKPSDHVGTAVCDPYLVLFVWFNLII